MFDVLLTKEEQAVKQEVRDFVKKEVSSQLLRDMDAGKVQYPREYVKALADRNLLGLRFSKKYGGREMKWTAEVSVIEEIAVLGSSLGCLYSLPSIVGEALHTFGSEEQKEKYKQSKINHHHRSSSRQITIKRNCDADQDGKNRNNCQGQGCI